MTHEEYTEQQTMLCLALLSYREFHRGSLGSLSEDRIGRALSRGLEDVTPLRGRWDLAWGPATYRAPFTLFDDSLMYVVRSRRRTAQYAVVVRGTNPFSLFDWVFGDLWVDRQIPWRYGDRSRFPEAAISVSTSLGLSIMQQLRAQPPDTDVAADVWGALAADVGGTLRRAAAAVLQPIGGILGATLRELRESLRGVLGDIAMRQRARLPQDSQVLGGDVEARLRGILDDRLSPARRRALALVDAVLDHLGDRYAPDLLRLLEGGSRLRSWLDSGTDLRSFLKAAVDAAATDLDIVVTGHSKGGALAPTLALWLAETQGTDGVSEEEHWDAGRRATVRCVSFAGPTAGNAAFAARSDHVIGPVCHRVWNALDVVPHAWDIDLLRDIPKLYGDGVRPIPGLKDLVAGIIDDVERRDYRHGGLNVRKLNGTVDPTKPLFVDQAIHQHLEGYIDGLDLRGAVNANDFFSPLS